MILDEVCELIIDTEHKTAPNVEVGIPSIRTPNVGKGRLILDKDIKFVDEPTFIEWTKRAIPRKDDLIIAREAPVGNVAIVPDIQLCLGQRTVLARPDIQKVNPVYLCYYLLSPKMQHKMLSGSGGSTVAHLNMKDIRNLELETIPSLPTQRKIAAILSAYDDLIENNLKRVRLLEEKAQLYYKELMHESSKWERVRLEEFVSVVKGRKPENVLEQPEEGCQLYLLLDTVERGKTLFTLDLTLPQSKLTDVLMCMDGARSGLAFRGMVGAIGSTMAIWRSNSQRISGEFLYQFMKQNESAITQGNTGAAIPHANRKFILDMKIAMPPKNEANIFERLTTPINKLINIIHSQNTKLREARDILLPRLMNGEIVL